MTNLFETFLRTRRCKIVGKSAQWREIYLHQEWIPGMHSATGNCTTISDHFAFEYHDLLQRSIYFPLSLFLSRSPSLVFAFARSLVDQPTYSIWMRTIHHGKGTRDILRWLVPTLQTATGASIFQLRQQHLNCCYEFCCSDVNNMSSESKLEITSLNMLKEISFPERERKRKNEWYPNRTTTL